MKKKLKLLLLIGIVLFLLLQLTNPPRSNPPVIHDFIAATTPPGPVAVNLVTACYDCHSRQTTWPWYSRIAPVSWLVANDVVEGRTNLDLSDWPVNDPKRAAKKIEDMSEEIGYHEMPPKKYTLIHANARLTEVQQQALTDWLDAEADELKAQAKAEAKTR